MTTTTLPTPHTVPRRSLRTGRKTYKVQDDSEKEERQEKWQPALSTMRTRLDLGKSRRSRGSITVTRNTGSGKGPRIGTVGDLKAHENVSRTSKDNDDGRRETLASDGHKAETPKNRNPGTKKVDNAFVVLSPTAQEFLQAQGITSALTLASTVGVVPFLDAAAREFLLAQGISTAEAFLSTESATLRDALMHWRNQWGLKDCSFPAARQRIYEWKRKLRKGQRNMSRHPIAELDADLKTLSSMARGFLLSQGIATAKDFLSTNSNTTANALMDWRKQSDSSECSFELAQERIYVWKKKLRERQSSVPGEPLLQLDADLNKLGSIAGQFLSSQGIATAKAFLSTNTTTTVNALIDWRKAIELERVFDLGGSILHL